MFGGHRLDGDTSGGLFQFAQSNANIDWAQLAQLWIQQNSQQFVTSPANNIENVYEKRPNRSFTKFEEQGEADMDMDEDDVPPAPPPSTSAIDNVTQPSKFSITADESIIEETETPSTWNVWPNSNSATAISQPFQKLNPTAHIPSLMKISVANPNHLNKFEEEINSTSTLLNEKTLDAAKRKRLPAWIREGLEKMEREKQKQLEREQRYIEKEQTSNDATIFNDITVKKRVKKTPESDDSSDNEQEADNFPLRDKLIKTKYEQAVASNSAKNYEADDDTFVTVSQTGKSYEQKLADLMIAVRRTLTELLLEVTNEEIAHIAQETLKTRKLKGLAAYSSSGDSDDSDASVDDDRRRSSNNAGEDSEEEIKKKLRIRRRAFAKISDEIEERVIANASREEQKLKYYKQTEQHQQKTDSDSDHKQELTGSKKKDASVYKMAASSAQSGEIGKNYARDFGETTDSKLQSSNGKRSRDRSSRRGERTTRFSDNKDSKSLSALTVSYISQLAVAGTTKPGATLTTNCVQQLATNMSEASTTATKVHNLYSQANSTVAGMSSILNAADVALEKAAAKSKNTTSSSRQHADDRDRHREHYSDRMRQKEHERGRRHGRRGHNDRRNSSAESDSTSDTTDTSNSETSSDSSRHSKYSRTSSKSSSRQRKHSRSSNSNRYHYQKRSHRDKSSYSSSKSNNSKQYDRDRASKRSKERSRSRSRSTYSSSSNKRHRP